MDILMPQLGETVDEGTIATWHKTAGAAVEKGELLLDVETDKVATEIPAPISGILTSINVAEGETVDVGTVLAVINAEGEQGTAESETAEPVPETVIAEPAVAASVGGMPEKSAGGRLSPAVRRLLKEHDLDISAIQGTGRDGRVTRQDVLDHIESGASAAAGDNKSERIPFDRIRKVTAEHMVRSKATSPHVLQTIEVDFSAVDAVRLSKRDAWREENGYSLSYLPFVARALCKAIADYPHVNASVDGDSLLVHGQINLAIAIDLNHEGLVAPVTRNADALSVSELARQFNELGARAKSNSLVADDLRGGTYTLSNPGPFGTLFTAPIINQPQVAILSMDAIKKRPVVIEGEDGDSIEIRPVGVLAHSFDHRAIDGAYSAAFLNRLRAIIEESDWEQEY
jgi:2-oxoglutarate dehydrogenase E2 component (dihydrolipoamide succinyltransferase)